MGEVSHQKNKNSYYDDRRGQKFVAVSMLCGEPYAQSKNTEGNTLTHEACMLKSLVDGLALTWT